MFRGCRSLMCRRDVKVVMWSFLACASWCKPLSLVDCLVVIALSFLLALLSGLQALSSHLGSWCIAVLHHSDGLNRHQLGENNTLLDATIPSPGYCPSRTQSHLHVIKQQLYCKLHRFFLTHILLACMPTTCVASNSSPSPPACAASQMRMESDKDKEDKSKRRPWSPSCSIPRHPHTAVLPAPSHVQMLMRIIRNSYSLFPWDKTTILIHTESQKEYIIYSKQEFQMILINLFYSLGHS